MVPAKTRKQVSQARTYVVAFTDYGNRSARLVYYADSTLPPLYGFSIYFTHSDFDKSKIDAIKLLEWLIQGSTLRQRYCPGCPIHLKLFFLPGAENEACINHYQKEKKIRGTYQAQIEAIENHAKDSVTTHSSGFSETEPTLPGFVSSYVANKDTDFYHGLLFIQPGEDWNADEVRRVQFDPVSQDEYDARRGADEPETLDNPFIDTVWLRDDNELGWVQTLGNVLARVSLLPSENETNDAWQRARALGWTLWPPTA